jgi:hypothetical protein
MSAVKRLMGWLWARTNARVHIVASEDESSYYAWVDEYLDRLESEFQERERILRESRTASTIDEGAAS